MTMAERQQHIAERIGSENLRGDLDDDGATPKPSAAAGKLPRRKRSRLAHFFKRKLGAS